MPRSERIPDHEELAARLGEAVRSSDDDRAAGLERAGLLHRAKEKVLARRLDRLEKRKEVPGRMEEARDRLVAHHKAQEPLEEEIARARIASSLVPPADDDVLLVHGRVLFDTKKGAAGLTVAVLENGRQLPEYAGTDARGYFKITLKKEGEMPERDLVIQVSDEKGGLIYREERPAKISFGHSRYVEIAIGPEDRRRIAPPPG